MADNRDDQDDIAAEPVQGARDDLDALLSRMTPDTFHDEADFGPPVGNEVW
jgi:antitoxin MazE